MGIENRSYYRDSDDDYAAPWGQTGSRSIVMLLIIINVVIFGLDLFTPRVNFDGSPINQTGVAGELRDAGPFSHWLSHTLSLKTEIFRKPWQFFTLLTYGFAHTPLDAPGGPMHILFNMLTLFFLGHAVEAELGRREFLRFYLVAVVLAGLAFLASTWLLGAQRSCLGASGAVSAVVMLFILKFPQQKLTLFGAIEMPAWVLGVLLIALDFVRAFNPDSRIAVETHLMGAAFAAAYFYGKWNFGALASMDRVHRPNLQVHYPDDDDFDPYEAQWEKLRIEGDRILEKINRQGQDSLTWRERRTLQRYSEMARQRRK